MKIAGASLGIGVLDTAMPASAAVRGEAAEMLNLWEIRMASGLRRSHSFNTANHGKMNMTISMVE
jgi:hypothetical protein